MGCIRVLEPGLVRRIGDVTRIGRRAAQDRVLLLGGGIACGVKGIDGRAADLGDQSAVELPVAVGPHQR